MRVSCKVPDFLFKLVWPWCVLFPFSSFHLLFLLVYSFHFANFMIIIIFIYFFCSIFCFISFHIRCPAGQIRVSPDRAECVYDTDCFGVNKCLNGGTCVSKTPFATSTSTCICPPFFDGARCEIVTDAKYVITGGKDFVIIIIFSLAILLSKFYFSSVFLGGFLKTFFLTIKFLLFRCIE